MLGWGIRLFSPESLESHPPQRERSKKAAKPLVSSFKFIGSGLSTPAKNFLRSSRLPFSKVIFGKAALKFLITSVVQSFSH
jgi:hypothetical protein